MSDVPFGFRSDDEDDDKGLPQQRSGSGDADSGSAGSGSGGPGSGGPDDPLSQLFAAFGGGQGGSGGAGGQGAGMPDLGQMLQQIGQMLSWSGGPVNWDLANQSARQVVAAVGDKSVSGAERRDVDDAFRLADTWLNDATAFPAGSGTPRTWSRAEWVEGTQAAWQSLVDPVATRVSEAMSRALPEEMAQAAGPLVGMMQQLGVSMWGAQVGQSIGKLAGEVMGSSDIGFPLTDGQPVLLPANVRAFGEGLGVEDRDVFVYLALREAAHVRLYAHAPWLRSHLISLVEEYARHVNVDTDRIESTMRDIDPQRPEAIQEALEGGLFDLPTTPAQEAALNRLELALALIEGWVHDVVSQAAGTRLPSAGALAETVRRRRATGGPAEQTFATLVGLQLRPRRLREAAAFWAAIRDARGVEGRDAIWAHPDLVPDADDLADPAAFLARDELDPSALDDAGPAQPDSDDSADSE
jgi:putative hydrolase